MNRILLLLFTAFLNCPVSGQNEFKTYNNTLIYSEVTMGKLGKIVDSLNLKYKSCDMNRIFYSKSQTVGYYVTMDSGNVRQAKRDMDEKICMEIFMAKYPEAKIKEHVLLVKSRYKDHAGDDMVTITCIDPKATYSFPSITHSNKADLYSRNFKESWLYDYSEKSKYSKEYLEAFYFPAEFISIPLPRKYCLQVGYADCLVDTTSRKFKDKLEDGWVSLPENWEKLTFNKKYELLDKMRSTRVIGGCSMDSRPRVHAMNIALLSAETANWEVFLKSHLDVMNDRFERMSDGSWAWAQRKTYIRELEELNIEIPDLLFGISIRMENPAHNHYYGSMGRLGRAISESKNIIQFKSQMLSMIEDNKLDDYNRVLAYFLFQNFNSYLENKQEQQANKEQLLNSVAKMPAYLGTKMKAD